MTRIFVDSDIIRRFGLYLHEKDKKTFNNARSCL